MSIKQYLALTLFYGVAMYLTTNSDGILQQNEAIKMLITSAVYLGAVGMDKRQNMQQEQRD